MAKDALPNKTTSSSSSSLSSPGVNSGNTSPTTDQQKVPPLRIVLNTSGNQKSAYNTVPISTQPQSSSKQQDPPLQQSKNLDTKLEVASTSKTSGKVRIRLGSNRQSINKANDGTEPSMGDDSQKLKNNTTSVQTSDRQQDIQTKEDNPVLYSHLRRITRRSQRAQNVTNDDEESRTSMTSIDDIQTSSQTNQENGSSQDGSSNQPTSNQATGTASNVVGQSTNSNSNQETPRRYKRRKGETSECQLSEFDGPFKHQNYKPPHQNSFELFKGIRRQVDDKLKSLNSIHPKTPYGFREYMLSRGAYLLDGNKLGNGTNLFMNEDGGIYPTPISKYHAIRHKDRVTYSVPNRAKVPLGLPVSSPLYNLFIEQEKERYKMRIQHLKEREKLTLAAEQEIMRVYNQAALDTANQLESLSACTMLKHQEIYNSLSLDADSLPDRANDDNDQDYSRQDRVRTRRRNQTNSEQISPPQSRKNSGTEETTSQDDMAKAKSAAEDSGIKDSPQGDEKVQEEETPGTEKSPADEVPKEETKNPVANHCDKVEPSDAREVAQMDLEESKTEEIIDGAQQDGSKQKSDSSVVTDGDPQEAKVSDLGPQQSKVVPMEVTDEKDNIKDQNEKSSEQPEADKIVAQIDEAGMKPEEDKVDTHENKAPVESEAPVDPTTDDVVKAKQEESDHVDSEAVLKGHDVSDTGDSISEDQARQARIKEIFVNRLQEIDDKWDRIRNEMLIRHRNEAESLHAVQKLEWEWRTKEIGLCDVRTTPVIDNILVPKLEIHNQDY